MGVSKVVYDGNELINLTHDDVTPDKLLDGIKAHNSNGDLITGTCKYDVDSSEFTATAAQILKDKTAGVGGEKVTGTMPNRGGDYGGSISTKDGEFKIQDGYHDGSSKVVIDQNAVSDLTPENIREGRTILGVLGTMTGNEAEKPQPTKEVAAPLSADLLVKPDDDFTCLTEVLVKKVPYEEIDNGEGKGITVKIG